MNDELNNKLNDIPLPKELDKKIEIGFQKARLEKYNVKNRYLKPIKVAVVGLIIVVSSVSIIGFDKVQAAINQVLQYIPGYNIVVDKEDGEVLALQNKVFYEKDDIFINVLGSSKNNDSLSILIESNYNDNNNQEIKLKDKSGIIRFPINWNKASGGEFWEGNYKFEVVDQFTDYSLLVGKYEVPFSLEKTIEVEDFLQIGNSDSKYEIDIVAMKKLVEDRLMVSLLNQSKDRYVYEYPFEENLWGNIGIVKDDFELSMYLLNSDGDKIYPNIPSSFGSDMSDFYFDVEDQEGLKLILPYIKIIYNNLQSNKVKLIKPKEDKIVKINKRVELGKFKIDIIDIENRGEELIINLTSKSPEDEILEEFRVMGIDGYGIYFNEETRNIELSINENTVGNKFYLYFQSPISLLLGNWEIDLD